MKTFNWKEAADYINDTYFGGRFHVYLDQVVYNANGKIEFRVPRVLVKEKDVYAYVNRHVDAVHGTRRASSIEGKPFLAQWHLSKTRILGVRYEPGVGTFISITDTGD
jgi:hypothetical protein